MNRKDEFIELKKELEETPVELEYISAKAILRVKKQRRRTLLWKTPLISFCSIAITFVLLVNLFPAVALAMSNIPILENLVSAVAFDPSLKAAVENDYYQFIGESQTKDDITVKVEYMIVDAGHISLFFSVDSHDIKAGLYHFDLLDAKGNYLTAATSYDTMYVVRKLEEIKADFIDGSNIPNKFTFHITVNRDPQFQEFQTQIVPSSEDSVAEEPVTNVSAGVDYDFNFMLYPDQKFIQMVESIPINQSVTIQGQRIYLDRLDIFPTQARLMLHSDRNNSAVLKGLNIYFMDENGKSYEIRKNGITSTGSPDSSDMSSIYFDSSYFAKAKILKLYIDGISIIDKAKLYGEVKLSEKAITNLPEGVTIDSMQMNANDLELRLKIKSQKKNYSFQIIDSTYFDMEGKEYYFNGWGTTTTIDNDVFYTNYVLKDYEDHKFKLRWCYSPMQTLGEPIEINLK